MKKIADDVAAFLISMKEGENKTLSESSIEQAREALLQLTLDFCIAPMEIDRVHDQVIPVENGEITARLYWPINLASEKPGLIVHYHGGGWTLADLETHDSICRYYSNQAAAVVMSVGYRLAPEFKFPIGVEDCYTALCWAIENAKSLIIDPERIAVTGDSAGGNLAAVMCILSSQRQGPKIKYQALAYPSVDSTPEDKEKYPSMQRYGGGDYFITLSDMEWIKQNYFNEETDSYSPLVSPILADELGDLPPALIITAGYDPLHDQGKAYADKLASAGVNVEYYCYEDSIHGLLTFAGILVSGREALELIASKIKCNIYT